MCSAAEHTALKKLGAVDSAYWTSTAGCLEGTRVRLLRMIVDWAHGVESIPPDMNEEEYRVLHAKNIFWLYGLAGAGKSTIANTVAKTLALDGVYLACYFCTRDGSETTAPHKLFPTIAYQLALRYAPYREALVKQLYGQNSPAALNHDYVDQRIYLFEGLFNGPPPKNVGSAFPATETEKPS